MNHAFHKTPNSWEGRPLPAGTRRFLCNCGEYPVCGSLEHCQECMSDHLRKTKEAADAHDHK